MSEQIKKRILTYAMISNTLYYIISHVRGKHFAKHMYDVYEENN